LTADYSKVVLAGNGDVSSKPRTADACGRWTNEERT